MQGIRVARFAALAAAIALVVPGLAAAGNEVTKWNEISLNAIVGSPPAFPTPPAFLSAPPASAVFVAMVQGAVYGAVNAADRHGRPYLIDRSYPKASADAAAATAAYKVLSALYPGQQAAFDAAYAASLTAIPDQGEGQGRAVGEMAATAMLAEGHNSAIPIGCMFGTGDIGVWQPLAGAGGAPACDPTVWVANAKPFVIDSPSQFRTAGPYSLGSPEYAVDYAEVKSIGSIGSTTRTPGETHAAAFWQTSPAPNYNGLARRLVDRFGLDVRDSARLFALLDLSAADGLISVWNDKYHYNFWRPITAIRRADDGNPATVSDPTWTPLFSAGFPTSPPLPASPLPAGGVGGPLLTPPYPDHPSGATAYGSASMHALASFFGTDELSDAFYLTSSRFPGEQRQFTRFSDVTTEIVGARIWAGIHFRNTDVQAEKLGGDVERYVHKHLLAAAH
ncbi:MAG: vanadium-dependent haloperoxidase [Gaiellaceae bacterium]